jgi:hypothetical protein
MGQKRTSRFSFNQTVEGMRAYTKMAHKKRNLAG